MMSRLGGITLQNVGYEDCEPHMDTDSQCLRTSIGTDKPSPEVRFAPKTVKVVDKLTGKPVSGALVIPIHLQLTNIYAAKTYLTDTNGIANPIVDVADYSAFKV